jgi:hypothetical protein
MVSMTVNQLLDLRSATIDDYVAGTLGEADCRRDLAALAVEMDQIVSAAGDASLDERARRVLEAILDDSRARLAAVPLAKAARAEFWHRRRLEQIRREAAEGSKAGEPDELDLARGEPDEVRMTRPILVALGDAATVRKARELVQVIAVRPKPEVAPEDAPAFPGVEWSDSDRLLWEEFAGGVPCQSCGRPFLGHETEQLAGEAWSAYRERMKAVEAEFLARHPDHGVRWTVGGGPFHCRRCCAPHPLSPQQIAVISRVVSPPGPAPTPALSVRRCGTCHEPLERDHVCQVENLPKRLRAVVEAVLEQERGRRGDAAADDPAALEGHSFET